MATRWRSRSRDISVLTGGLLGAAGAVVVLSGVPGVSHTTVALVLLLIVLATATLATLWIATIIAIAATLAFNYFFFPPVGTLAIAGAENWVALAAFLVVAVIASQLSAAAQARAREAIERRNEVTRLLTERDEAERLRQKAELASTLLASLSHDLKTPLTALRVAVENLRGDLSVEERRAQAAAATAELERLNRLFQHILDMARIDTAALRVEPEWVTPADVVDAALAQVGHAIDGRPVHVRAEAEVQLRIDPRVASVALSHLLENAAQYSPADRDIEIDASATGDELSVSVTDHGPGLEASDLQHLFERFYRGQRARQLAPGTGMGLAITRGLLAAVGGRVWAENAAGGGARLTMTLPGQRRTLQVSD
jgi:two-component system sensor histidine kinase KdpD